MQAQEFERKIREYSGLLAGGRTDTIATGAIIGRIELLQKLLHRQATPRAELEGMPIDLLETIAAQLGQDITG